MCTRKSLISNFKVSLCLRLIFETRIGTPVYVSVGRIARRTIHDLSCR